MSMSKTLSYGTDILFIIFAVYLFFYYFDIFLKRRKRTVGRDRRFLKSTTEIHPGGCTYPKRSPSGGSSGNR